MSAGNAQLAFAIRAVNEASAVLKQIQADVGGLESKASAAATGGVGKFGGALSTISSVAAGVVAGGAIQKLGGFLSDAAHSAAEDEASTQRVSAAIKALGGDYDQNIKSLNAAIEAGQKKGFTDDETRDATTKLSLATGDMGEAMKRLKVAQDLARGANIPLADASKLLGKVTDENLQVFKKMGITLPDVASEADVLAAVQGKFAGQADAYAQSSAGQFAIASDKISEMKEAIGYKLIPVMTFLVGILSNDLIPAIGFLVDHFNIIGPAVGAGAIAIGATLVPAFIAWATTAGAAALATLLAAAPVIAIGLAVALLVAGIILLVQHWDEVTAKFPALGTAADGVKTAISTLANWVTGTFIPNLQSVIDFVKDHWDEIETVIKPIMTAISAFIDAQVQLVKGSFQIIIDLIHGDFSGAWNDLKTMVSNIWGDIQTIINTGITAIKNLAPDLANAGWALGNALGASMKDAFVAGLKGLVELGGDIATGIENAIKYLINQGIDAINSMIPNHIGISIAGHDIGFDVPNNPIPHLAAGGIVTRPTLAVIGEAGPEAVVPLGKGGAGMGLSVVVNGNVYGPGGVDWLMREIDRASRRLGGPGLVSVGAI